MFLNIPYFIFIPRSKDLEIFEGIMFKNEHNFLTFMVLCSLFYNIMIVKMEREIKLPLETMAIFVFSMCTSIRILVHA